MRLYNWFFKQKVKPQELKDAQTAADAAIKQNLLDSFFYGFIQPPTVTERNTSANMSVDVNPPLKAFDENGEWIYVAPGTPINISLANATLPAVGNQRYALVQVSFDRFTSDPRIDGYGDVIDYILDNGYTFDYKLGTEAAAGSAVVPTPDAGKMAVAAVLLSEDTTSVTNSLISTTCQRLFSISDNAKGVAGKNFELNRENTAGQPGANDVYSIKIGRGQKPAFYLRLVEGANPLVDPPVLQYSRFISSENFSWHEIASKTQAGGWEDLGTHVVLENNQQLVFGSRILQETSSYLSAQMTDKGFAGFPAMTTAQRDAIASPVAGLTVYNTDTNTMNFFNGTMWSEVGAGAGTGEKWLTEEIDVTQVVLDNEKYSLSFIPTRKEAPVLFVNEGGRYTQGEHFNVTQDENGYFRDISFLEPFFSTLELGDKLSVFYPIGTGFGEVNTINTENVTTGVYSGNLVNLETQEEVNQWIDQYFSNSDNIVALEADLAAFSHATSTYTEITGASLTATMGQNKVDVSFYLPFTRLSSTDLVLRIDVTGATALQHDIAISKTGVDGVLSATVNIGPLLAGENTFKLMVSCPDNTNIAFEAGQFSVKELNTLESSRSVSGTVTDSNGDPIENVTVEIPIYSVSTTTDANGDYTLSNLPNAKTLLIRATLANYQTYESTVDLSTSNAVKDIEMTRFSLSGTILSSLGSAVEGANVSIASLSKSAVTDASGNYSLLDVPNGTYTIQVSSTAYIDTSEAITVSGNTTYNKTVNPNTVTGTITSDTTGADLASVAISVGSIASVTNASGDYTLNKVVEGTRTINAQKAGFNDFSDTLIVVEGQNTRNIEMVAQLKESGIISNTTYGTRGFANAYGGYDNVANRINVSKPFKVDTYSVIMGGPSNAGYNVHFQIWSYPSGNLIHRQIDVYNGAGTFTNAIQNSNLILTPGFYLIHIQIQDSSGTQNDIAFLRPGSNGGLIGGVAPNSSNFNDKSFYDPVTGITHYSDNSCGPDQGIGNSYPPYPGTEVENTLYGISISGRV